MKKSLLRALWAVGLGLLLCVVPAFLFNPDSRSKTDITRKRQSQNHAVETNYFIQELYSVPPALQKYLSFVVAIDFNHDGFKDLIAIQGDVTSEAYNLAPFIAYTNDGYGHFIESTSEVLGDVKATNAQASIVADFNGDGFDDLFIVDLGSERNPYYGQGKGYFLFIQKPNGTLVNEASLRLPEFPWLPYGAAAGDVDGDESIDLLVVSTGGPIFQLMINNGQGYFSDETARLPDDDKPNWWPNNCQMLDVNKDGYPDIFMGESAGHYPQDYIFMNDGTGHFSFAPDNTLPPHLLGAGTGTTYARVADLDGDGWMDLVLSEYDQQSKLPIQILFNNGNGTFRDVSNRISGPYLDTTNCGEFDRRIADVNGDGWPDLLAARNVWGGSFSPRLFINHAGLQFEDITSMILSVHPINAGEPPRGEFVDIDNDGDMDVIGVYYESNQIYVLVNQTPYAITEAALPYPAAPSLTSPANRATVNTSSLILAWDAVNTAFDYDVQVSTNADFSTTVTKKSHHTTNSLALNNLTSVTTYYWRVRAHNSRGAGSWSSVYHFCVFPFSITVKDEFLGTWNGQGVYYQNSDTGGWVELATPATTIAAGDLDGDGIDDLIGIWPSQGGVWVKCSQSGTWANLSSTADWIAASDMNGDGRAELLGSWTAQGVFWRNNTTGAWTQLATPAMKITAGDLDGDGKDDLIGIWPSQGGVWVKYSQSGEWANLSSTADWIATGDMNGDGRDDLVGAWTGQGVYYRDSMTGQWIQMSLPAIMVATGDLDTDGKDDLIGIWPSQGGVWVKYSQSGSWELLSSTANWIATGKMRTANSQALGNTKVPPQPMGGLTFVGPLRTAGFLDLSANSPGRDGFKPIIETHLKPEEKKKVTKFESRIPGPGEPGFRYVLQKNIMIRISHTIL